MSIYYLWLCMYSGPNPHTYIRMHILDNIIRKKTIMIMVHFIPSQTFQQRRTHHDETEDIFSFRNFVSLQITYPVIDCSRIIISIYQFIQQIHMLLCIFQLSTSETLSATLSHCHKYYVFIAIEETETRGAFIRCRQQYTKWENSNIFPATKYSESCL